MCLRFKIISHYRVHLLKNPKSLHSTGLQSKNISIKKTFLTISPPFSRPPFPQTIILKLREEIEYILSQKRNYIPRHGKFA